MTRPRDRRNGPTPYERIKTAILDGTFGPGDPLVEASVADWCGVSRTPVREALTRLEQDGLARRTEFGLVVRVRSPEEILDIYRIRIVLEEAAARTAAERHTEFDVARMERLLQEGVKIDPTDESSMVEYNRRFHLGVWRAGHNEALIDLLERLDLHLLRFPATTLSYGDRWREALAEHRDLVNAIARGDADRAGRIARKHFTTAREIRLRLWEQQDR